MIFQSLKSLEKRLSVGTKINILMALSIFISSLALTYFSYQSGISALESQLRLLGVRSAKELATRSAPHLSKGDTWELFKSVQDMTETRNEQTIFFSSIEYAAILDANDRVAAHSDPGKFPLLTQFDLHGTLIAQTESEVSVWSEIKPGEEEMYHFAAPVTMGREKIGWAMIGISEKWLMEKTRESRAKMLLISLAMASTATIIGYYISRRLLRPLKTLSDKISTLPGLTQDIERSTSPGMKDEITVFMEFYDAILGRYGHINRELTTEKEKLNNILNGIHAGMIVVDREMNVTWQNRIHNIWFGESLGHHCFDETAKSTCPNCPVKESFATERIVTCESRKKVAGGGDKTFSIMAAPLHDAENRVIGALELSLDITHQVALKEDLKRKERLALMGQMAAGMAHEIRNPLNALITAMQIVAQDSGKVTAEQSGRLLSIINKETARLNATLNDFLSFAQSKSPRKTQCDLNMLLTETIELLKHQRKDSQPLEIAAELNTPLPGAPLDHDMMRQIMWNLLMNGIQSMPNGGVIKVATGTMNGHVYFSVKDTGTGMTAEEMENCFIPFYTRKSGGLGLGMAIVRRIVDQHNGAITMTSDPGKGSEFCVAFPMSHKPEMT
jgi:signal transduction histidine kinase